MLCGGGDGAKSPPAVSLYCATPYQEKNPLSGMLVGQIKMKTHICVHLYEYLPSLFPLSAFREAGKVKGCLDFSSLGDITFCGVLPTNLYLLIPEIF